jgi:hypothetical protein
MATDPPLLPFSMVQLIGTGIGRFSHPNFWRSLGNTSFEYRRKKRS